MQQATATTLNPTQQPWERTVNAVCVDVLDLGIVTTPWGKQPQVELVFESDATDQYGEQRILVRRFHKHTHEMSSLSIALKSWCNRSLWEEEAIGELDLNNLVGQQAILKLQPTRTKSGGTFDKITEILSPGTVEVQPWKYHRTQE
jgi:hypothetical protein